jgi:hypothetical protein
MAARSVQLPVPSLHTPSERLASAPSAVELTVKKAAARAFAVVGVGEKGEAAARSERASAVAARAREVWALSLRNISAS